jgi:hypothetical protein
MVTESTNFSPEGLGPDFTQAFSDQPFQVASTTEQQEQDESTFAQNTLVHALASGKYVVSVILKVLRTQSILSTHLDICKICSPSYCHVLVPRQLRLCSSGM